MNRAVNLLLCLGAILTLLLWYESTLAWDGYDYETGTYVDIEAGQAVRVGKDVDLYDWETGEYTTVEVEAVHDRGGHTEVEVYDWESGEYRTLDMD